MHTWFTPILFSAILHYFAFFGRLQMNPQSDHVIAYAVVTHPYPPRRLKNISLGSNNTQMNIIEATPGSMGTQSHDRSRGFSCGDQYLGKIVQNDQKWGPLFFEIFSTAPKIIFIGHAFEPGTLCGYR